MLNFADAIESISKVTRQKCDIFTLMHYISNGYLDVFIKGEYDLCYITQNPPFGDELYDADSIEYGYKSDLAIHLEHKSEILEALLDEEYLIPVVGVKKRDKPFEYVLLQKGDDHTKFALFKANDSIDLQSLREALGFRYGCEFSRIDFRFDEKQIEKLPYAHPAQNVNGEFYAPELALALRIWEKTYVEEKGVFAKGVTREKRVHELIKEANVEDVKTGSNLNNFKARITAIVNPKENIKINNPDLIKK